MTTIESEILIESSSGEPSDPELITTTSTDNHLEPLKQDERKYLILQLRKYGDVLFEHDKTDVECDPVWYLISEQMKLKNYRYKVDELKLLCQEFLINCNCKMAPMNQNEFTKDALWLVTNDLTALHSASVNSQILANTHLGLDQMQPSEYAELNYDCSNCVCF